VKSPVKRKSKAVDKPDDEANDTPKKKPKKETTEQPAGEAEASKKEEKPKKDDDTKGQPTKKSTIDKTAAGSSEDEDDEEDEELKPGLLEQPVVLEEGCKREKKKVQRLEVTPTQKERKLEIVEGTGTKLGDIPRVELQIQKTHAEDLKPLHRLLFDRLGATATLKKSVRQFSGFTFSENSPEFEKKTEKLSKFTNAMLKVICEVLDIERKGKKDEIINRIMHFLLEPTSSGKSLPTPGSGKKRRRSSTTKKSAGKKAKSDSKTKSKKKPTTKEEGSSDDDVQSESSEDENEKSGDKSEKVDKVKKSESSESSDEDEPAKKKKKKETPAKKTPKSAQKKAVKKTPKAKKAAATPKKKSKKAKSESSDESSDNDDEPLEKKKDPPTDAMLKAVIKKILKTANLEEVTMKTVCKQVYEKYPEFDLTSRKDFIKATVKQILK
jgi:protein DEK